MALYGLVAMVSLMLLIVAVMAWYMPEINQQPVVMAGGGPNVPAVSPELAVKPKSADALAGKILFASNCSACHSAGADKILGPGLAGVRERSPGEAWLQKWIRNSSVVIASGDAYATKIYADYGKIQMTTFPNLTDQQIRQMLDYVDSETVSTPLLVN